MSDLLQQQIETCFKQGNGAFSGSPSTDTVGVIKVSQGSLAEYTQLQPTYQKNNGNLVWNGMTKEATSSSLDTNIDKYQIFADPTGGADAQDGTQLVAEWSSSVTGLKNGQDYTINEAILDGPNGFAEQGVVGTDNAADYTFEATHDGGTESVSVTNTSNMTTSWTGGSNTLTISWGGNDIVFENTSGSEWTNTNNFAVKINGDFMVTGNLSQSYDIPDGAKLKITSIDINYS